MEKPSQKPPVTRTKTTDSAREIIAIGEFGYPVGHLGHLTDTQAEALVEFKKLCQEKNLFKPASDINQSSHDDVTMLRFLRARRFVPQDALQQFTETEAWREANKIGDLYNNIDIKDYEETRRLYADQFSYSTPNGLAEEVAQLPYITKLQGDLSNRLPDKRGIPVYVFEVAPLNSKTMSAYAKSSAKTTVHNQNSEKAITPPRMLRLFALYENLVQFIMPLCSNLRDRDHPTTPISQSNNIVDISGVGLKQFWNLRTHMQDASTLATAHYPETLDRIFIIGAPSFFPTVWGWIKRWFDPITTSKIFILGPHEAFKTLSAFIEPANIPKKYGGSLDYEFGMPPILDPAEEAHITWAAANHKWPEGPMRWVPGKDGTLEALAVGSINGKERREVVATMHPDGKPEFAGTQAANQIVNEALGLDAGAAPARQGGPESGAGNGAGSQPIPNGVVEDFLKAKYSSAA
ncbi:hypothetical protein MMC26_004768 [Xylographa opegraphella]|nr:hypothetical protein [Xylographa opegraphella]